MTKPSPSTPSESSKTFHKQLVEEIAEIIDPDNGIQDKYRPSLIAYWKADDILSYLQSKGLIYNG